MAHSLGWLLIGFVAVTVAVVCLGMLLRRRDRTKWPSQALSEFRDEYLRERWRRYDLERVLYRRGDEDDWEEGYGGGRHRLAQPLAEAV